MVRALVCPGQGAQSIGMGKSLAEEYSTAKAIFEEVDEALGEKLSNLIWEGDIADLTLTQNAQPALMAMSLAVLRGLESEGFDISSCSYLAGHSLGEYSALAMSKAISVSDAARLLRARGLAMQDAVPVGQGAMAAILGLNFEAVQSLTNLAQAQASGICQAANDNDPSQVVISGEKSAVELAIDLAKEEGAKRAIMLPVSAPFHCELMAPAAEQMKIKLDSIKIDTPILPIISNVSAEAISDPDTIKKLLVSQVTGSVRWRESVLWMVANDVDEIWEVGSGKALSGMIRRINKDISLKNFSSAEDIKSAVF
ncbi:MAG: [acyl-carrier-protein] S-malonyltransferase [Rhodobacteraceae bacterium TMED111]|nr:[acyl-carrier-protein] S-malonyltransferase [Marinovum sp.]OUV41993.1 MAG: [acyl-carrier-protein] S-malonyltransferase [Rhodobacteraceae bacterium TMED111]